MSGAAARAPWAGALLLVLLLLAGCGERPRLLTEASVPSVSDVLWLGGDSLLAVALHGRGVALLDAATGTERGARRLPFIPSEPAFGLAASATGETLAVALSDSVRVFRTRGLVPVRATPGRARTLALSGDGGMLLWSDEASRYALNVHTGQVHAADFALSRWSSLHWVPFMDAFAWSAGREVRFAPREGPGGMSLGPFMDGLPGGLALSHQGHTVAVAESTDHVSFWDARKERMRWRLKLTGAARFERMALSGDTWYLATARGPRVRLLWAYTGREVAAWPPHGGAAVRALAFARDGRRLATVGADDRVRVWSVPEPRKERR